MEAQPRLRVAAIPALSDNYVYALAPESGGACVLVDPGEARATLDFLDREARQPTAILLTHHHDDHVGGVSEVVRRFPGLRVVGAERDRRRLPPLTESVVEGDTVQVAAGTARVLDVHAHTRGHVAYFFDDGAGGGDLFSGDTVFGATIGNLFEGSADDMYAALAKIRSLPPATRLWCGHEYTLQYVREAARFDPGNARLQARLERLEAAGEGAVTVPLTLEEERATSPFFRCDDPALARRLGTPPGIETFRRLCELL